MRCFYPYGGNEYVRTIATITYSRDVRRLAGTLDYNKQIYIKMFFEFC